MKLEEALQTTKFKNQRHKAGLHILYTAWLLRTIVNKELREFKLTHEQYNILRILNGKHPEKMCVKDIAGRMIEKSSNVPRIIDRLESKKLIIRKASEKDGRQTMISLTPDGIDLLSASTKKVNGLHGSKMGLTEEEATLLNELLEKMHTE